MSWDALGYVTDKKTKVGNSTAKLVLIFLANYADENYQSYPSISVLAELCESNERTIKRALTLLHQKKIIEIKERFTMDGKQTSNLYTILIRGDKNDGVGVTNSDPNTININKTILNKQRGDKKYPPDFEQFWQAYPRHDGSKKSAYKIWSNAIAREIDVEVLLLKTIRFKVRNTHTEKRYIPHATTWLNQKRWETIDIEKPQTTKNQLAG